MCQVPTIINHLRYTLMYSLAISPHFVYDMLQGVYKFCAVIMQILMENGVIFVRYITNYSSYKKCDKFRFFKCIFFWRGEGLHFFEYINSHHHVARIWTPVCLLILLSYRERVPFLPTQWTVVL
jgi:hypothetical protein